MFTELPEYPNYKIYEEGFVVSPRNKVLSVYKNNAGYCFVGMKNVFGENKKVRLHRIVAQAFLPNKYNLPEVNHIDGDKSNNNLNNLEWVTSEQNKHHAWGLGLYQNKTEDHYNAVLSNEEVHSICELLSKNVSNSVIAELYGVDRSIIAHIKAGDTWKDISNLYEITRKLKPRKNKNDIHEVCKLLSECVSFNDIIKIFPQFNKKDLYRIKNKQTHKNISDLYFTS